MVKFKPAYGKISVGHKNAKAQTILRVRTDSSVQTRSNVRAFAAMAACRCDKDHCRTGSPLARTNLSPFARCTLGLCRHFY